MLQSIVADVTPVTFSDVSSALSTNISADTILSPIVSILPWVGLMVGVAIGIYFLRRAIKKVSKAKAGL